MTVPQFLQVTVIAPVFKQNVQVFSDLLRSFEQETHILGGFIMLTTSSELCETDGVDFLRPGPCCLSTLHGLAFLGVAGIFSDEAFVSISLKGISTALADCCRSSSGDFCNPL